MKTVDVKTMNEQLRGFSEVAQFNLAAEQNAYTLKLTLANEDGASLTLVCVDVQNLELNPAGNGFEQMMLLKITDMREDGLERIHFSVEEMEHETLFLHCASVEVKAG
jgi:hypothetical protein